jgi:hypothetical protein
VLGGNLPPFATGLVIKWVTIHQTTIILDNYMEFRPLQRVSISARNESHHFSAS